MKYIILLLAIGFVLTSCSEPKDQMLLTGTVKGLKKGTLLLQKIEDTALVSVDSVVVDGKSEFSFNREIPSPEVYFLYLRLENGALLDDRIPFFAEAAEIQLETSLKKFGNDVKITGSVNQGKLEEYKDLVNRFTNRNLDIIEQSIKASQEGNDSLISDLQIQQNKLIASKYLATVNYALQQKDHEVAPYLMLSEVFDANIKYLDTVYSVLPPKVRESKYGKELADFIEDRKAQ
ncbi:DUF4369 domain-containing protein [Aureitalea sp. L0-47]|uniref:DUF4369 domain-containing protein n=1 Tax=Aureitalea sp. L0-47 TaxID=2816962 RepID=UPI0022375197|nr:DUF4369 domain-containing protein [Aureitalea sp. L0-47]MCW5520255.1 DUF4369 domain-containing protein [Aureitalea sp. L0-47]